MQVIAFRHIKPLVVPEAYQANLRLDALLCDVSHQFVCFQRDNIIGDILDYLDQYEAQLLTLLTHRQLPPYTRPTQRTTVVLAQQSTVPLLCLRI